MGSGSASHPPRVPVGTAHPFSQISRISRISRILPCLEERQIQGARLLPEELPWKTRWDCWGGVDGNRTEPSWSAGTSQPGLGARKNGKAPGWGRKGQSGLAGKGGKCQQCLEKQDPFPGIGVPIPVQRLLFGNIHGQPWNSRGKGLRGLGIVGCSASSWDLLCSRNFPTLRQLLPWVGGVCC